LSLPISSVLQRTTPSLYLLLGILSFIQDLAFWAVPAARTTTCHPITFSPILPCTGSLCLHSTAWAGTWLLA
jgi:hypothetical protein